jgi:hypothetical protein
VSVQKGRTGKKVRMVQKEPLQEHTKEARVEWVGRAESVLVLIMGARVEKERQVVRPHRIIMVQRGVKGVEVAMHQHQEQGAMEGKAGQVCTKT